MKFIVFVLIGFVFLPPAYAENKPTWRDLIDKINEKGEDDRREEARQSVYDRYNQKSDDDDFQFQYNDPFEKTAKKDRLFYDTPTPSEDRVKTLKRPKIKKEMDWSRPGHRTPMTSQEAMEYQFSPRSN